MDQFLILVGLILSLLDGFIKTKNTCNNLYKQGLFICVLHVRSLIYG